jgi:hypothetical protein
MIYFFFFFLLSSRQVAAIQGGIGKEGYREVSSTAARDLQGVLRGLERPMTDG